MPDLRDATVEIGVPGLNGTGVTAPEKTDIFDRLTALEALTPPVNIGDLGDVDTTSTPPVSGDLLEFDGTDWVPVTPSTSTITVGASFLIDGGGAAITSGVKGDLEFPFACTITRGRLFADQSGTIAVSLWKDSYANYPPVVGDLLATWTISAATKYDSGVAGLSVAAGDIIRFNVNALATSITRVTVSMTLTREV